MFSRPQPTFRSVPTWVDRLAKAIDVVVAFATLRDGEDASDVTRRDGARARAVGLSARNGGGASIRAVATGSTRDGGRVRRPAPATGDHPASRDRESQRLARGADRGPTPTDDRRTPTADHTHPHRRALRTPHRRRPGGVAATEQVCITPLPARPHRAPAVPPTPTHGV
jgi:hypothetical protein